MYELIEENAMIHHSDTYYHFHSRLQRATPADLEEGLRVCESLLEWRGRWGPGRRRTRWRESRWISASFRR